MLPDYDSSNKNHKKIKQVLHISVGAISFTSTVFLIITLFYSM